MPGMAGPRNFDSQSGITIATTADNSTVVEFHGYASGLLLLPATASGNTISIYVREAGGTYIRLRRGSDGTAISMTKSTAAEALSVPTECFGAQKVKFVASTNQMSAEVQLSG